MRDQLSVALAKHMGQELTLETARAIVNEACAVVDWSIDPAQFAVQTCAGYTLQCERLAEARDELRAQRIAFLQEVEPDAHHAVDWGRLAEMALRGALVIFTVRAAGSGTLFGSLWLYPYVSINTGRHVVSDDMFYIAPQHRGGLVAVRLWQYAERAMFAAGAREFVCHSRLDNGAPRMARFMGYRPMSTCFKKTHCSDDISTLPTRHGQGGPF